MTMNRDSVSDSASSSPMLALAYSPAGDDEPSALSVSTVASPSESKEQEQPSDVERVLGELGFKSPIKITDTLQGSVWRAERRALSTDDKACGDSISTVIKVTSKELQSSLKGLIEGTLYAVDENILTEQAILKYLTQHHDCPPSIVRFYDFVERDELDHFYLAMEDGGSSLFRFVAKAHHLLSQGIIDLKHWQKVVATIFRQMLDCVHYMHSKHVAHYDISVENWLINDVSIEIHHMYDETSKSAKEQIQFNVSSIQVKLCDFGLAEMFTRSSFASTKRCGKRSYKSPESWSEHVYDAQKSDVWGLGVSLFMMVTGYHPWDIAKATDPDFKIAMQHSISTLLRHYKLLHYFDDCTLCLVHNMLQLEEHRATVRQLQSLMDLHTK